MRLRQNVAIAGTHGKTTTTSMVAALLDGGGVDPTVINGGIIQNYGSNARLGTGDWMVVEADESDGTFVKLPATIAIVTNIDPEHMDHYGDFDALRDAFLTFVSNIPFYGVAICCIDHAEVQRLVGLVDDRRIVTYGFSRQADVRAENLRYEGGKAVFDVIFRDGAELLGMSLPMPGEHNVSNALAAIATARELGVSAENVTAALAGFGGVKRRFTHVGMWNGAAIIDDYGHHPVEIAAVLKAARAACDGKLIAVHQPHRYTRLADLFEDFCGCFNDADIVGIMKVYEAGEEPIEGADREGFVAGLRAHGHRAAEAVDDEAGLLDFVKTHAGPGDMVVCLGAGTISGWTNALPAKLTS